MGLEHTLELSEKIGNPHKDLKFIHMAGTNGKGSCSALIESVLRTSGKKVGLFTSPYLINFNERIRVDGISIINFDIILPILKAKNKNNTNIIKVVTDKKNKVLYLSRANIPFEFKRSNNYMDKHLSIISFKPDALVAFAKHKKTRLESIEDIELLRALEIGLTIKKIKLDGDSFSVDIYEDYARANKRMSKDKFFKLYK